MQKPMWPKIAVGSDNSRCFAAVLNVLFLVGLLTGMPLLILTDIVPYSGRYLLLLASVFLCGLLMTLSGATWKDIGVARGALRDTSSGIFVGLLFSVLLGAYFVSQGARGYDHPSFTFVAFYAVVSVPAQEFIYRSSLFYGLRPQLGFPAWFRVAISTALYSFMHTIYGDVSIVLATIVFGVTWGIMYERRRSLLTVCISHLIVGVAAFTMGLG